MKTTTCMPKEGGRPKFLAVDFYCGAGGTTRGLLDAGGYVIAGIDKDTGCRTTYQTNNRNLTLDRGIPEFLAQDMFPASPSYPAGQQSEIRDRLNALIPHYRRTDPGMPLLFAICAPCQSFNRFVQPTMTVERAAMRERDLNLLSETSLFVEAFQPDMVLCENISGIERGKHGQIWADFRLRLQMLGYQVGYGEVCASKFGVAQRRRRSIIFAVRCQDASRLEAKLPIPTESVGGTELTVREVIGGLDPLEPGQQHPDIPNHECRNLSSINRRRLVAVPPGEKNFGFPEELQLPCHRRLAQNGKRGFGDVYTRVHPDRPSGTLTTRFHSVSNGRFGHYDAKQARGLSFREGALLQSFGLEYVFHGNTGNAVAKMIGNAVPPKLAEHMALSLYELWSMEVATGDKPEGQPPLLYAGQYAAATATDPPATAPDTDRPILGSGQLTHVSAAHTVQESPSQFGGLARIHRWTRTEGVRTLEGGVRKLQTRWPGLEFG